jgi:hypothetical protein
LAECRKPRGNSDGSFTASSMHTSSSPCWGSSPEKSTVLRSICGGVPVFKRSVSKPRSCKFSVSQTDFNTTSQMQKSVRYAMGGMRCVVRSSPAGNAKTCCILQWMSEEMQRCDTLSSLHLGGTQTALHVESHGEYYVLKLDVVASVCVPFGMIRSFFW